MDMSLLIIKLSCFTCCLFFHVAGGVHAAAGDYPATAMDQQMQPHPCLDEERSALLEFIQDITIERYDGPASYHKTDSWKAGGDCCASWDGVDCDRVTGHVIGLDLSSSSIYGSLSDNITLFQLLHLQKLNLSGNHLQGQIPSSIFHLSNLSSLDLSDNVLTLLKPNLKDMVHNLTKLEHLHLDSVDMTGTTLHDSLSSHSCMRYLHLANCGLSGEFPSISKLRVLDLSNNFDLSGHLPEFDGNNSLEELRIGLTSISGELPSSMAQLSFLKVLDIGSCYFSGRLPSLGGLANLTYLDLSGNDFRGQMITPWLANLTQLVTLDLSHNQLTGQVPYDALSSLTKLESLWLQANHFTGSILLSLTKLINLQHIDLSSNRFEGAIPNSFSNLNQLQYLNLNSNNLNGTVELDMFHKLEDLSDLRLSQNNLSLLVTEGTNSIVQDKYTYLELGSCNLSKFPTFLLNQTGLVWLDLSENNIHGMVPKWIWNHSVTLYALNISHNFLTAIEDHPIVLPGSSLRMLDISFNVLQASLPVPPLSTSIYLASSNNFSGHLSPLFCNVSGLSVLDIPHNNISGTIPQCPGTFGTSLLILNLRNNKLHGTVPESWTQGRSLQMIALSQNQLQGKIPRSLGNCMLLEFVDLGSNHIVDTFPYWLGDLPRLKILLLQSNRFHGEIKEYQGKAQFAQLQIIDLSFNGFSGKLPSMYFQDWKSMEVLDVNDKESQLYAGWLSGYYEYSMNITNKGMEMKYGKILNIFKVIDFSHNRFEGEIPTSIGKLEGLHLLNLGHNNFTGTIPSWLGDLRQLESLDLSHNKLSGKIPRELSQLSFLAFFNVSYNNLSGTMPRGGQFDTFEDSSYQGNPGLLADPQREPPTPKTREEEDEDEDEQVFDEIEWMMISIGCGSGLVVGAILGNELVVRKPKWFVKLFGRWL